MLIMIKKNKPKRILYQDLESGVQGMFFSLYIYTSHTVHSCLPPCGVREIALSCSDAVGQKAEVIWDSFPAPTVRPC